MTEQRLKQVRDAFERALRLAAAERPYFLDRECGLDRELRTAVEGLLRKHALESEPPPMQPDSSETDADQVVTAPAVQRDRSREARAGTPRVEPETVPLPSTRRMAVDHGRFAPGDVIASRYRIVALLGRGGMGEVYRADDLTLSQPVALKFLPVATQADPVWLADLLGEVRTARQIAHPNVCRVYDIEEHDGRVGEVSSGACRFITMEYVTGEPLDSLLRRAGRLSGERALQIARGLCDGLAAIHDAGVLHRDFKPSNVLIDADGKARITDFGLATAPEGDGRLEGAAAAAGTPGYIAPEALAGKEATIRSDVYGLGLVLFELFTGRKAYEGNDGTTLLREQERDDPLPPSEVAPGIDPLVERVIQRCLERNPAERPGSARMVSRMLPGGDPLAAALALGETPSPEVVAASGHTVRMNAPVAGGILALVAVGLFAVLWLSQRQSLIGVSGLEKQPAVLADRAQQILRSLRYEKRPESIAYSFDLYEELLEEIEKNESGPRKWEGLRGPRPTAIDFWYRQSPTRLVPLGPEGRVTWTDPPPVDAGMIGIRLTPGGLLRELTVMSYDTYRLAPKPESDRESVQADLEKVWDQLFAAAGLERGKFKEVEPARVPSLFADTRAAWRGTYPENPRIPVRVEAGTLHGHAVAFRIVEEVWSRASELSFTPLPNAREEAGQLLLRAMQGVALAGAIVLARRHWVRKRGDWSGARRIAVFAFLATFAGTILVAHPHAALGSDIGLLGSAGSAAGVIETALGKATFWAAWMWLFYIALEPIIRRIWPEIVISWARLLSGRVSDPLVGRSVLFGVLLGVAAMLLLLSNDLVSAALGRPARPYVSFEWGITALDGLRVNVGLLLLFAVRSMQFSLVFVMGLALMKMLVRRRSIAAVIFGAIQAVAWALVESPTWNGVLMCGIIAAACTFVLVRFGLVALAVGGFVAIVLMTFPFTADLDAWYASSSLLGVGTIAGLATLGALAAAGVLASRRSPFDAGALPTAA